MTNSSVPLSPISDAAVLTMRQWLSECDQNHVKCKSIIAGAQEASCTLPTRLLDIGNNVSSRIQLVDSKEVSGEIKYVSLSHCWGTSRKMCLLQDNMRLCKQVIHFDDLPRTFRDAIVLCRILGVRYLWIDSLCIIQDCTDDWKKESGRMGSVFENSLFTIAASRAAGDEYGFLGPRQVLEPSAARNIDLVHELSKGILLVSASSDSVWRFISPHASSPLSSRAWVVQERLLARKSIAFATTGMQWSCRSVLLEESGRPSYSATENIGAILDRLTTKVESAVVTQVGQSIDTHNQYGAYELWYRVVEQYTGCAITKFTDRLPALAGIVGQIALQTQQKYYAGVWEHCLIPGLLWQTLSATDLDYYRAPSWSWASVNGEVLYRTATGDKILATVDSISTDTDPLAPYGEVSGGVLQISAYAAATVGGTCAQSHSQSISAKCVDETFAFEISYDTEQRCANLGTLYLLPLVYRIQGFPSCPHRMRVWITALAVVQESKDLYQRVGIATSHFPRTPTKGEEWPDVGSVNSPTDWWIEDFLEKLPRSNITII